MNKFPTQNKEDVSSLANFHQIKQLRYAVEVFLNFEKQGLEGFTIVKFQILDKDCKSVVLDAKDLKFSKVYLTSKNEKEIIKQNLDTPIELKHIHHVDHPSKDSLGTPLEIFLPEKVDFEYFDVKIEYISTKEGPGLQWLNKEQTHSGKFPYVFSQCEAILARTCVPCQDSPSIKVYFDRVSLIAEEGIEALFGGELIDKENITHNNKKCVKFNYTQKVIIPTYLFSLAAGEIVYKKISERVGVYSEPYLLEKACEEFKDIEDYIKASEDYFDYKYIWGDYNVLFLPQAFPYGGMENPNLTFLNNALLVGDKSMVGTIAHEIAHSWTGNLVTNKDWNNFWMNEGFTVFMERKLVEIVQNKEVATLEADVGYDEFLYAVKIQGEHHNYTCLCTDLKDEDPDDAFSVVPYEKGFNLLYYIEKIIGEDLFRDIIRKWIKKYAYQSISYPDFKNLLESELKNAGKEAFLEKIDWDTWVNKPGFLPVEVDFKNNKYGKEATSLYEEIISSKINDDNIPAAKEKFGNFLPFTKIVFLNLFLNNLSKLNDTDYKILSKVTQLNTIECNHPEIMYTWLQVALHKKDEEAVEPTMKFLGVQGRMKYIKPVFIVFYRFKKEVCREFFEKYKHLWHSVATRLILVEFGRVDQGN